MLALLIGVPMGVYTGIYRNAAQLARCSWSSAWSACRLPTFLIGILLILVFSVLLGWLPSFGRGDVVRSRLLEHRAS